MKILILSLVFLFPTFVLSQTTSDSIDLLLSDTILFPIDYTEYVNNIDLVENRKDTTITNFIYVEYAYELTDVISSKNIIIFDEFDNLLTIQNEKSLIPKYLTLTFKGENGNSKFTKKYYVSNENDVVTLIYNTINGEKQLVIINIDKDDGSDMLYCYYNKK